MASPNGLFHSQKAAACASLSKTNNVKEPVKSPEPQSGNLTAKPPRRSCPAEGARFLVKPDPSVNHLFQCLNTGPGGQPRSAVSIRSLAPGQLRISEVLQSVKPAENDTKASVPAKRLRRFLNSFLSERLSSMERFASAGKFNLQKIFTGRRRVVVPAAEEWGCIRPSPEAQPRMGVKTQVCAADCCGSLLSLCGR